MEDRQNILLNICSGKNGVGKSFVAANLAWLLSQNGFRVLIWDGDYAQSMQNYLFGVKPRYGIQDIIENKIRFEDSLHKLNSNLFLLSNLSISNSSLNSNYGYFESLYKIIKSKKLFDFIIFDASSELNNDLLKAIKYSKLNLLMINDDPISIVDAYALIKIMKQVTSVSKIKLLINNTIDEEDAINLEQKLNMVIKKFLNLKIENIGYIPYDRLVRTSIINQNLYTLTNQDTELYYGLLDIMGSVEEITLKKMLVLDN